MSHHGICVTTLRTDVRLTCVPSGLSANQISKEKRNHIVTSKKPSQYTLKGGFAGAGLRPGLAEQFWGTRWGFLCGLFCCGTVEEQEDGA